MKTFARIAVLVLGTLVVTASECPFLPVPGTTAFICFTEVPVGPITPGKVTLQLREFCPDGPVVGTIGFFFLGPGAGVPSPTYEKLPNGRVRIVNGALATDNASLDVVTPPDFQPSDITFALGAWSGVRPDNPLVLEGFDVQEAVCEARFPVIRDDGRLSLLGCTDAWEGQFQLYHTYPPPETVELELIHIEIRQLSLESF